MSRCRVCGHTEAIRRFDVREMMMGTRERFPYVECAACGGLQIESIPEDLAGQYQGDYYSYRPPQRRGGWKGVLLRQRDRHVLWGPRFLRSLADRFAPASPGIRALAPVAPDREQRTLDVGCGAGELLFDLMRLGFSNLLGIDPFNAQEIDHGAGLRILPIGLNEVRGSWDLVMMHHSLEHMPDPAAVLSRCAELLAPGGHLLIRTPIVPSLAWEKYGADWVQLDAPRHLFVPSLKGLGILARRAGLRIRSQAWDSTPFQFWASEQYRLDIPLSDARSHGRNPKGSIFSGKQIKQYRRWTREANRQGRGDQVAVLLVRQHISGTGPSTGPSGSRRSPPHPSSPR